MTEKSTVLFGPTLLRSHRATFQCLSSGGCLGL